jgi:enamine deaminase RidA (YjgF/YER057c/UK114 family)
MSIQRIAPGPRMSRAVVYGGMVFLSGQVDDSANDVTGQTKAVLAKLDALLAESGSDRAHLLSASIWLADIATFDEMNAVWETWIDRNAPPARATVEAALSSPKYLVEIALIAAVSRT